MTNEARIAEWIATSRQAAVTSGRTAEQLFEQSIRDMSHAGFRLPSEVVRAVRSALQAEG